MTTTDTRPPAPASVSAKITAAAAIAALVIATLALVVSITRQGPRGVAGPPGQPGPAGQQGPAGPAGADAPVLSYTCQQLFPKGGPNGTETTMYWPCTDNPNGG